MRIRWLGGLARSRARNLADLGRQRKLHGPSTPINLVSLGSHKHVEVKLGRAAWLALLHARESVDWLFSVRQPGPAYSQRTYSMQGSYRARTPFAYFSVYSANIQ